MKDIGIDLVETEVTNDVRYQDRTEITLDCKSFIDESMEEAAKGYFFFIWFCHTPFGRVFFFFLKENGTKNIGARGWSVDRGRSDAR